MTAPRHSPSAATPFALLAIASLSALLLGSSVAVGFLSGVAGSVTISLAALVVMAALALIVARADPHWRVWALVTAALTIASSLAALFTSWLSVLPGALALSALLVPLAQPTRLPRGAAEHLWGWLFVAPAVLLLVVWHFAPAFYALALSFLKDFNFLAPAEFAGFENYAVLIRDPLFWKSLVNSAWYVVGTVPVGIFLATLIAILLNERVRFLPFFRTVYFLPYITALTAAAAVWKWI